MITDSFDSNSKAIINPYVNENAPQVDACILTFSDKIKRAVLQNYGCKEIGRFNCATHDTPVYLIEHNGRLFTFYKTIIGAPACVGTIEDSFAVIKTRRYVVFGGAGCLNKEIAHGKVMVPTEAYRDEGTSYHYAPPSDYIEVKNSAVVARFMEDNGIPYIMGKTWTTDAFYRETADNFKKRKADGCITVEMECAALQAMCGFRGLEFYTFFTGGDLLDAPEWDPRHEKGEIRDTQHDSGHFDIALALAEFVCENECYEKNKAFAMDRVLTLDNWWDGPLLGLCTFNGEYCVYERVFSEPEDEYTDFYYLTPVSDTDARKILDNWREWCGFIDSGKDAVDWVNIVNTEDIAKKSPRYRGFRKHAEFKGVRPYNLHTENIIGYFVKWT